MYKYNVVTVYCKYAMAVLKVPDVIPDNPGIWFIYTLTDLSTHIHCTCAVTEGIVINIFVHITTTEVRTPH